MAKIRMWKEIDKDILYYLITEASYKQGEYKGWKFIESEITSCDEEDGGASYDLIIKEIETNTYYLVEYNDWDIRNTDYDYKTKTITDRCDLDCRLTEVVPQEKTIIVYVPKK